MSHVSVISRTQKIIVDPFSSAVAIVNAGPMGPGSLGMGGSWTYSIESVHNTTHNVDLVAENDPRGYLDALGDLVLPPGLWFFNMTWSSTAAPGGTYRAYSDYRANGVGYGVYDSQQTKEAISSTQIRFTTSDSILIPVGSTSVTFRVRQHSGAGFTINGRVTAFPIRLG